MIDESADVSGEAKQQPSAHLEQDKGSSEDAAKHVDEEMDTEDVTVIKVEDGRSAKRTDEITADEIEIKDSTGEWHCFVIILQEYCSCSLSVTTGHAKLNYNLLTVSVIRWIANGH